MWPFTKSEFEVTKESINKFTLEQRALQTEVFNSYPVGKDFEYMGIKLKVTANTSYRGGLINRYISIPTQYPSITCNYVSGEGVITEISFSCPEVKTWYF